MLQCEFENGIGVDLSYLPFELRAKWFEEVELYYMAKQTATHEESYKHFRRQIKKRVKALKEFRFSSNLELRACLRLALQRLDDRLDYKDAKLRHGWVAYIESIVGSDDTFRDYSELNAVIQAIRGTLTVACGAGRNPFLKSLIERLVKAFKNAARFEFRQLHGDENQQIKEVANTVARLVFDEFGEGCPYVSSVQYMAEQSDDYRWNFCK